MSACRIRAVSILRGWGSAILCVLGKTLSQPYETRGSIDTKFTASDTKFRDDFYTKYDLKWIGTCRIVHINVGSISDNSFSNLVN